MNIQKSARTGLALLLLAGAVPVEAEELLRTFSARSRDLGGGFIDHGIPVAVGFNRGMVSAKGGRGESVVLAWMHGHSLLEINVETGVAHQHPNPYFSGGPFSSILASDGRYYAHQGFTMAVFDPVERTLTKLGDTRDQHAMSMTEDDEGVIWAATFPNAGVVSYDPRTGAFRDYGPVHDADFRQYPRHVAADDRGWIYFATRGSLGQIVILNRETGEARPVLDPRANSGERGLWRAMDGKVYARQGPNWFELHHGRATPLQSEPRFQAKPFISGAQDLRHRDLPNGEYVQDLDVDFGRVVLENRATGASRVIEFEYEATAAILMRLQTTSDGRIFSGTAYPWRFCSYDPRTDEWTVNAAPLGQWNAVVRAPDGMIFAAMYPAVGLMQWDPDRPWTDQGMTPAHNPRFLDREIARPHVWRPTDIFALPDGKRIIWSGFSVPEFPGGGLLMWDRETETTEILTHEQLIPRQNNASMLAMPDGKLLVGTTIYQWGGPVLAENAMLYMLNLETRQVEWRAEPVTGAVRYYALAFGPKGEVFALVTGNRGSNPRLIVFDPERRVLVYEVPIPAEFKDAAWGNAPSAFVTTPDGRLFVVFRQLIAELDTGTYQLNERARPPRATILGGGVFHDGRIYFSVNHDRMYSWRVEPVSDRRNSDR